MIVADSTVTAACHCGKVQITLAEAPGVVVECNCSLCRSYGVIWAYYSVADLSNLPESGATHTYAWNGRNVDFHRCSNCGCVTHWVPRSARRETRGINARLLPQEILSAARLRHKDGARTGKYLD